MHPTSPYIVIKDLPKLADFNACCLRCTLTRVYSSRCRRYRPRVPLAVRDSHRMACSGRYVTVALGASARAVQSLPQR
jgi:hypothetical protein